jgi:hypothetical protein
MLNLLLANSTAAGVQGHLGSAAGDSVVGGYLL